GTAPRSFDLFDLKGVVEAVFGEFDSSGLDIVDGTGGAFQPGQCADVNYSGQSLGRFGLLAPTVAKAYDFDGPVYLCEMDLDPLFSCKKKAPVFAAIPAFPESTRDLAVVVDANLAAGTLAGTAEKVGGKLLK